MLIIGWGLSFLLVGVSLGPGMGAFRLLSMIILVALYLPWCRYLEAQECVMPWLYIDNLMCLACDPDEVLHAARFTTGYVRLVGQEPAPCKCVLISTSKMVRNDMRDWVLSQEGDRRSLHWMYEILGSSWYHFSWLVCYSCCSGWAGDREFVGFSWEVRVVRAMFIPGALHCIETSVFSQSGLFNLRAALLAVVWSRRQPVAHAGAVLSLLGHPEGCILGCAWFSFGW